MEQMELFFDGPMLDDLVAKIDECLYHTRFKDGIILSGLYVRVPTPQGNYLAHFYRQVVAEEASAAENEIRSTARILAREVKAIIEFKDEFSQVSFMDDEGRPVAVGAETLRIDRHRLGAPVLMEAEEGYVLNIVREKSITPSLKGGAWKEKD